MNPLYPIIYCSKTLYNHDIIRCIRFVSSFEVGYSYDMHFVINTHLIFLISVVIFDVMG
jgi:hypothetical protein